MNRTLSVVVCGLLLAGCQSPLPAPAESDTRAAEVAAALQQFTTFSVSGGLGLWTDEQSITARLDWQQTPDRLEVTLDAPLGLGTARLTRTGAAAISGDGSRADSRDGSGASAELWRGGKLLGRHASADVLLQQALGLEAPLPLEQLGLWMRGMPGDARVVRRDESGRLAEIAWDDAAGQRWRARMLGWTQWQGLPLPSLISARSGPYSLRLKLNDWSSSVHFGENATPDKRSGRGRLPIPGR